jgi:hypothetical protein
MHLIIYILGLLASISAFGDFAAIPWADEITYSSNERYKAELTRENGHNSILGKCHIRVSHIENGSQQLVWERYLINNFSPVAVLVSNKGEVVTLDDSQHLGKHAIVTYGPDGRLNKIYRIEDFKELSENPLIPETESGIRWRENCDYYISDLGSVFVVIPPKENPILIGINTGRLSKRALDKFGKYYNFTFSWDDLVNEVKKRQNQEGNGTHS